MHPRAVWKGFLKLEHIACPVALYKATSEPEEKGFVQINRLTGNRIKQERRDAGTDELVEFKDVAKAIEIGPGKYLEIRPEEIADAAPRSQALIEIKGFVPPQKIGLSHYGGDFYFLGPQGDAAAEAWALIRKAIQRNQVAGLAQVTLGTTEHLCAITACGKGLQLALLRYAPELRDPDDVFERIDARAPIDLVGPACEIVGALASNEFSTDGYEDRYAANIDSLKRDKIAGRMLKASDPPKPPAMTSLEKAVEKSVETAKARRAKASA